MSSISDGHTFQLHSINTQMFDGRDAVVETMIDVEPGSNAESSACKLLDSFATEHRSCHVNEMDEDTEEIDALLCSDEEDEETSTGRSPCGMIQYDRKEVNGSSRIATSVSPCKKRRLESDYDPSLMDTASSSNALEYTDDAETSGVGVLGPSIVNKRLSKKRMKEKLDILRTIIHAGESKDAAVVLDETIQCLKSLKLKAKALGDTATKKC